MSGGPAAPVQVETAGPPEARAGRRLAFVAVVVAAVTAAAVWRHAAAGKAREATAERVRTAIIRPGTVERTLRISGVIAAERAALLLAPNMHGSRVSGASEFRLILQKLVPGGSFVKKGDVVAEFDPQYMLNRLDDYRALLLQHELNLEKLRVQLEVKRKAYEQRIRAAKGRMDKAELDLKTAPIRSAIQTEHFKLSRAEAQALYRQLINDLKYVDISESSAIRRSELDLRVCQIETRRAESNVQRMVLRAPMDGLAVIQRIHRYGEDVEIEAGEQLHPGQSIMQIVDLRSMVMNGSVNQVDIDELRKGARARVYFDAYPGLEIPARVISIGAIAGTSGTRRSYLMRVPVRLKLEKRDARVVPNTSASAEVVLQTERSAAVAPLEAIHADGPAGQKYAYVRGPSGWERRIVETGLASNILVAVRSGLREGDIVALERPETSR